MDEVKSEAKEIIEKVPWQTHWAKKALQYSLIAWGFLVMSLFVPGGMFITLPVSFILGVVAFITSVVVLVGIIYKKEASTGAVKAVISLLCSLLLIIVFGMLPYAIIYPRFVAGKTTCKANLIKLGEALNVYSNDYGRYPPAEQWCDLLVQHSDIKGYYFQCVAAREERYHPTVDQDADQNDPWFQTFSYRDPNGRVYYVKRGYYAINPNCEPNSPEDIVLLFETKGGWNQFGEAEILTTEHHRRKGCNVLFNDGHVEFINSKRISQLKWKTE